MSSPIIYQVIGGILILLFFYVVYMSTRTWRWPQVTLLFLVFVAAITFSIYAAMSVRTHMAWKELHHELSEQESNMAQERDRLLGGDIHQVVQSEPSVRNVRAKLDRVLIDRGRVWRDCTPQQPADDGTVTVSTVPADAAEGEEEEGEEEEEPKPNGIAQDTILYAFAEYPVPEEFEPAEFELPEGAKVPRHFVGQFTATEVADDSVTLEPTNPLVDYGERGRTWALYESMPLDSHRYFAQDPAAEVDLEKDEPIFGQIEEEQLRLLFQPYKEQLGEQTWEAMLETYLRDGQQGDRDLPEENVWLKVQFNQSYEVAVDADVDQPLTGASESGMFFDGPTGRANAPFLQQEDGGQASFEEGNVAVFPLEKGDELVAEEIAEEIKPIYVRSLHNYAYGFRETSQRLARLERKVSRANRDIAATTESNRRTVEQIGAREQEQQKLSEDLEHFNQELEMVTEYAETLKQQKEDRRAELSRLYRANQQLVSELSRIEQELTNQIDRRTTEATAAVASQ